MVSKHDTLNQCWVNVGQAFEDAEPTLNRHWVNASLLLVVTCTIFKCVTIILGLMLTSENYPAV